MLANLMESPSPESVDELPEENQPPPLLRRSLFKRGEEPLGGSTSEQLGLVLDYLGTLQAQVRADEQRAAQAAAATEPGRKVLQEKRLSRSGMPFDSVIGHYVHPNGAESATPYLVAEPGILPESGWMDVPADLSGYVSLPLGAPSVRPLPYGAFSPDASPSPPRSAWSRWLLPGLVGFAVAALAAACLAWYTRSLRPQPASLLASRETAAAVDDFPVDPTVSDDALAAADETLDAVNQGDLARAAAVLTDAHRRNLRLPGLSYQLALLALKRGDENQLDFWTNRSFTAHEFASECCYLRALDANSHGHFQEAVDDLASAAHFNPFNPRYPFFWAESLRRIGKPALALPHFEQALRARPAPADADLITFKQRLARIEAGDDATLQAQLAEHLVHEPVPGDTWLLGAASKIRDGAYPAAVGDLRHAAAVLPPTVFRTRMRDYFFVSQAAQPDLAAFFNSLPPLPAASHPPAGSDKILVDPATRGLADADPAGW